MTAHTILGRGGCMAMYCEGGRSRTGKLAERGQARHRPAGAGDRRDGRAGRDPRLLEGPQLEAPASSRRSRSSTATRSATSGSSQPTREQRARRRPTRSSTRSRCSTTAWRRTGAAGPSSRSAHERRLRAPSRQEAAPPRRDRAARARRLRSPRWRSRPPRRRGAVAGHARAGRTFSAPVGVVAAPGDASRAVRRRAGRQDRGAPRHGASRPSPTSPTGCRPTAASRGCSAWPSRRTTRRAASCTSSTRRGPGGRGRRRQRRDLVISELRRADADHVDPASERVLLRIPHRSASSRTAASCSFGPDGQLWIGTGDGGGDNDPLRNAQRVDPGDRRRARGADALLGKILRIDPTPGDGCGGACTIPRRQPRLPPARDLGLGLRNPWRFSFDRPPATSYRRRRRHRLRGARPRAARPTAAVAPTTAGRPSRARARVAGTGGPPAGCCTAPVLERAHAQPDGYNAIIGGVVVRDPGLPALAGRYFYANLSSGLIRAVTPRRRDRVRRCARPACGAPGLTSFGEDGCGRVYATTLGGVALPALPGRGRLRRGRGDAVAVPHASARSPPARAGVVDLRDRLHARACARRCGSAARSSGRTATRTLALGAGRRAHVVLRVPARSCALRRAPRAGGCRASRSWSPPGRPSRGRSAGGRDRRVVR